MSVLNETSGVVLRHDATRRRYRLPWWARWLFVVGALPAAALACFPGIMLMVLGFGFGENSVGKAAMVSLLALPTLAWKIRLAIYPHSSLVERICLGILGGGSMMCMPALFLYDGDSVVTAIWMGVAVPMSVLGTALWTRRPPGEWIVMVLLEGAWLASACSLVFLFGDDVIICVLYLIAMAMLAPEVLVYAVLTVRRPWSRL